MKDAFNSAGKVQMLLKWCDEICSKLTTETPERSQQMHYYFLFVCDCRHMLLVVQNKFK